MKVIRIMKTIAMMATLFGFLCLLISLVMNDLAFGLVGLTLLTYGGAIWILLQIISAYLVPTSSPAVAPSTVTSTVAPSKKPSLLGKILIGVWVAFNVTMQIISMDPWLGLSLLVMFNLIYIPVAFFIYAWKEWP